MKKALILSFFLIAATVCSAQTPTPVSEQKFMVKPGILKIFEYNLSRPTRFYGRFKSENGKPRPSTMIIVDSDNLENLKAGADYNAVYNSGDVVVHTFDVVVPKGK